MPRIGSRKLLGMVQENLSEEGIRIGRDRFIEVLRKHGMLQKKQKRYTITTGSKHWMKKYPNLLKGERVMEKNQVWVSDITYIRVGKNFCYLSMITDAYTREIIGCYVNETLEAEGCVKALRMALREKRKTRVVIHHSDRGYQYCSREYVDILKENNIRISMTENGDPYENALAERMNRTIKEEFLNGIEFEDIGLVRKVVEESVEIYNKERPHLSLGMQTPAKISGEKSITPFGLRPQGVID